jgi:hypothetical protein
MRETGGMWTKKRALWRSLKKLTYKLYLKRGKKARVLRILGAVHFFAKR